MSLFKSYKLTLAKSGKTLQVSKARNVLDALIEEEVPVDYACQNLFCGRCALEVLDGAENIGPEGANERDTKERCQIGPEKRLTCKMRLKGDVTLNV